MIFVADIGNTNTVFGVFDGDRLVLESRIDTDRNRMADQYSVIMKQVFDLYGVDRSEIDGAVISSVVPPVGDQMKRSVQNLFRVTPLMVGAGVKTGLNIRIDDPSTLGADLACGAAAAKELYPLPCIVIDLGTATKVFAVDKEGALIGGIIAPGVKISLEALARGAASLPMISLEGHSPVIGTNTIDCMRSGVLYGHAGMLDSFIDRFQEELGAATVVATGGFIHVLKDYCRHEFTVNPQLVMEGMRIIYNKNKPKA